MITATQVVESSRPGSIRPDHAQQMAQCMGMPLALAHPAALRASRPRDAVLRDPSSSPERLESLVRRTEKETEAGTN